MIRFLFLSAISLYAIFLFFRLQSSSHVQGMPMKIHVDKRTIFGADLLNLLDDIAAEYMYFTLGMLAADKIHFPLHLGSSSCVCGFYSYYFLLKAFNSFIFIFYYFFSFTRVYCSHTSRCI
jgi:hypothetical protein